MIVLVVKLLLEEYRIRWVYGQKVAWKLILHLTFKQLFRKLMLIITLFFLLFRLENPVNVPKTANRKITTLQIKEEQHLGSLTCHVFRHTSHPIFDKFNATTQGKAIKRQVRLQVPPSKERCAMWKSQRLVSSSYVVNLIIFQPFLLQHTQKSIKLHTF